VSRCLAGPGVSDLDDDVHRLEGLGELSFCLGDVTGIPLDCRTIVTPVCRRRKFLNVLVEVVIVVVQ
jgi:hypothetical protein